MFTFGVFIWACFTGHPWIAVLLAVELIWNEVARGGVS